MANDNVDTAGLGSYGQVSQDHSYETDTGLLPIPLAQATPGFKLIRLHGGMALRRVKWTSARSGKPPIIPTPIDLTVPDSDPTTYTDRILTYTVTPSLPVPNPQDAGYNWHVSGEYVYIQEHPRVPGTNTLPTGAFPFPVAPMDNIGSTMIPGGVTVGGDNPFDLLMISVGESINRDSDGWLWPFTALPPAFSNDHLINQ